MTPSMTGAERVLAALRIEQPDRVPFWEEPNRRSRQALLPEASYEEVVAHFDLDAVGVDDRGLEGYIVETIDDSHYRNQWGTIVALTADQPHPVGAAIKTEKDLDEWRPPDPDAPWRYERLKERVARYKGERAIIASFADPFSVANEVRGSADHFMDFVRHPDWVDRLTGMIRDYYKSYIRNCLEVGADVIFIGGDYAATNWPMLRREHFVRHVIPVLKDLVDEAQRGGGKVTKHTDGNIYPILDLIVDTGIDGLHPIDPNAGMDLGDVKQKYGDRVCLMGNVDCAEILTWGTVEEVRDDVRRCLRQAAAGGGYICMSSNSIHSAVKPENYAALVSAIHEYGHYPISL